MVFIRRFLVNLIVLAILGSILFLAYPDITKMMFEVYKSLFGPGLIILAIIVAALPERRN